MNSIPAEDMLWLDRFKARLVLEKTCVKLLIQWGLTECAFDIYRIIEDRAILVEEDPKAEGQKSLVKITPTLSDDDKAAIRDAVRVHFTKTRDLPRNLNSRQLLQNGLLTGYENLIDQLGQFYEKYRQSCHKTLFIARAA
jgi:hypothetical protein